MSRMLLPSAIIQRVRQRRHHVNNVASYVIARIAATILYLAPVSIFVARQGAGAYGSLSLLLFLFGYLHIFDLGIGYSVNQRFARALARGNQTGVRVIQFAVPVFVALAMVVTAVILIEARTIAIYLLGKPLHVGTIRLLGVAVGFLMLSALMTAILQAYNRVDWINYSRLVIDVTRAAGMLAGAFSRDGIMVAVAVTVAGSIVKTGVDFTFAVKLLGHARALVPRFSVRELAVNVRHGFPMLVSTVLGISMFCVDRVAVSRMFGQQALAHYAVAADLCSRAYFLVYAITGSIYTLYVRRRATGRPSQDLVRAALLSVVLVTLVYYLPLGILAHWIVSIWISPQFAQASQGVMRIWAVAAIVYLVMSVYYNQLQGLGAPRTLAAGGILSVSLLGIGLYAFSRTYGIEGVAASVLLGFAAEAIFLYVASRRLAGGAGRRTVKEVGA
jgi:O-antigen/teichoic acid export membrane protein